MKSKILHAEFRSKPVAPVVFIALVFILIAIAVISTGRRGVFNIGSAPAGGSLIFEGINVDRAVARSFSLRNTNGVLVASEPTGSSAKSIGLHRGDVILALNSIPVNDVVVLMDMLSMMSGETHVKFTVVRDGSTQDLSPGSSLYSGFQTGPVNTRNILFVLIVFFVVFLVIFFDLVERTVMVSLGAVFIVILGTYLDFFDQSKAFASINIGTLALLVGMGFFAIFFEQTNFFAFTARKIALFSGGDRTKVMLFLCSITYVFSMFVNNLSTILVIVPIALKIADEFDMDVVPLLICVVISSNLGGASSMIGDFPNMLISSETKLIFHDFVFFMFPVCFIQLLAMFFYMKQKKWISNSADKDALAGKREVALEDIEQELKKTKFNQKAVKKGLVILSIVVVGFIFSDMIHINAPTIALAGGFFLLAFGGIDPRIIFRNTNFRDVLFFAALFVMVGAVDASGAIAVVSQSVQLISGGNLLVQALLLLWVSAFLTSFLNAGPATALFIPIIFRLGVDYPHNYIWWALSLGVLAGSCSTLTGATAGAVTATLMEDYEDSKNKKNTSGRTLSFRAYSQVGVPIMFLFLAISTGYIVILSIF